MLFPVRRSRFPPVDSTAGPSHLPANPPSVEFIGKVVLVTGGGRGIGRAVAGAFAQEGAAVAIAYSRAQAEAEGVVEALRRSGRRAMAIRANVAKANEVKAMVDRVLEAWDGLDVLVNNAAIIQRTKFEELSLREWEEVISVNLTGVFLCAQAAAPVLRSRGGTIVNVASIRGLVGGGTASYAASKGGLIALTKTLARDLAPQIRVNAVAPGYTETALHDNLTVEARARIAERIPLGRFAEREEIARAVLFLASRRASYITGQTLVIDGGLTMW